MVYAGILHDTYTDENGKKIPYEDKVIGVLKDDTFKCVSITDIFMTFDMPKEEFLKKTEDLKVIFD
jgi:hypothetical protein